MLLTFKKNIVGLNVPLPKGKVNVKATQLKHLMLLLSTRLFTPSESDVPFLWCTTSLNVSSFIENIGIHLLVMLLLGSLSGTGTKLFTLSDVKDQSKNSHSLSLGVNKA